MKQYLDLMQYVLDNGEKKEDRTGVGTISTFATDMKFNLTQVFPIVTTRQMPWKSILSELLWFISGSSNINDLKKIYPKNKFWDGNYVDYIKRNNYPDNGEMGKVYGSQWRKWESRRDISYEHPRMGYKEKAIFIDQLQNVIDTIKENPNDRRMIVTAWNPAEVSSDKVALPACHCFMQFYCSEMNSFDKLTYINHNNPVLYSDIIKILNVDVSSSTGMFENFPMLQKMLSNIETPVYKLSLQMYQRSCDLFLGVCANITSYALLLHIIAKLTNTLPYEFKWIGGDTHIYLNHIDVVKEQLQRQPYNLPKLKINDRNQTNLEDFVMSDFGLENYQFHPKLTAEMAV